MMRTSVSEYDEMRYKVLSGCSRGVIVENAGWRGRMED